MAKRKLRLLVQAMNIFAQLDERDRQTLADYVRSQTVTTRPKSVAPSVVKKSTRKDAEALARRLLTESGANTEDATVNVSAVGGSGD